MNLLTKSELRDVKRQKVRKKQRRGSTLAGLRLKLATTKGLRGTARKLAHLQKINTSRKQRIN